MGFFGIEITVSNTMSYFIFIFFSCWLSQESRQNEDIFTFSVLRIILFDGVTNMFDRRDQCRGKNDLNDENTDKISVS